MTARLLIQILGCCAIAAAQNSLETAFVQASRAALRAQPSASAPILEYLTTNTELRINRRSGEWCDVVVQATGHQGFAACRLLSEAKLTLENIARHAREEKLTSDEELDWAARAFWVSPSLRRFVHFAEELERVRAGEETQEEYRTGKPNRPPNAELNAMKRRLAEGITVEPFDVGEPDWIIQSTGQHLEEARRRVPLPPVGPSHFDAEHPPFVVPLRPFTVGEQNVALADALSWKHRVSLRARVVRGASMGRHGRMGAWDIGGLGISFERPVRIEAITQSGSITGADVSSMQASLETYCGDPVLVIKAQSMNSRWRTALLGWIGKPSVRATVMSRRHDGKGKFAKLVVDTIDLNADGVPDFSVWSGIKESLHEADLAAYWRSVFANLGGKWVLLRYAQEVECT